MGLPAPSPTYDVAKAFMASFRSAVARSQIQPGGMVKASRCGELLVVAVTFMPPHGFDSRFLLNGPGHSTPVFSPAGDAWWSAVFRLALAAAQGADQRDGMAAILLTPGAIEAARDNLPRVA